MNSKYRLIINTLIILLMIALVYVMFNYYASGVSTVSNPIENNNTSNENIVQIPVSKSGEILVESGNVLDKTDNNEENNTILDVLNSGENSTADATKVEEGYNEEKDKTPTKSESKWGQTSPVIMKSENDISSTEKREILGELDKTLMELLDVVDKVKTVDESRLPTDSEVEP